MEESTHLQQCPNCGFTQPAASTECGRCGVVFSKVGKRTGTSPSGHVSAHRPSSENYLDEDGLLSTIRDRLLTVSPDVNELELGGRAIVWLGVLILSWSYVTAPLVSSQVAPSFFHLIISRVDLVFHEAGHIFLGPFGSFLGTLGGSLFQVMIPCICTFTFLRYSNPFGASVALWWTGQNFIDMAPYMYDARAQQLILLGGVTGRDAPGYHDWNNILSRLGLLNFDHTLGRLAHLTGAVLIALALIWGGYLLFLQYAATKTKS